MKEASKKQPYSYDLHEAQRLYQSLRQTDQNGFKDNDIDTLKSFLENTDFVNNYVLNSHSDFSYGTLLHLAAKNGNTKAIELIIKSSKEINLNAKDNLSHTPLHIACHYGNVDAAKLLIEKGANVNAEDNFHSTPLHSAIEANKNKYELVNLLIEKKANLNIEGGFSPSRTPLKLADVNHTNDTNTIKLLLKNGAEPFKESYNHIIDGAYRIDQILKNVTPTTNSSFIGSLISAPTALLHNLNVSKLTSHINSLAPSTKNDYITFYADFITCKIINKIVPSHDIKNNELLMLQHVIDNVNEPALNENILIPYLNKRLAEITTAAEKNPSCKQATDLKEYNDYKAKNKSLHINTEQKSVFGWSRENRITPLSSDNTNVLIYR